MKTATIDSRDYRPSFYGILNAQGDFWTPLAFESEEKARQHVRNFWGLQTAKGERCLREFKFVPVRIRLTALAPVDTDRQAETALAGSGRSLGSAVGEAEAPCLDQGGDA